VIVARIKRLEERLRKEKDDRNGDPQKAAEIQKELDVLTQRFAEIGEKPKFASRAEEDKKRKPLPRTPPATLQPLQAVPEPRRPAIVNVVLVGTSVAIALILGFSLIDRYVFKICKRKTSERVPAALQPPNQV
jgi:hypothetical protein